MDCIEGRAAKELVENLLVFEPNKRWSTTEVLNSAVFRPVGDDNIVQTATSPGQIEFSRQGLHQARRRESLAGTDRVHIVDQ